MMLTAIANMETIHIEGYSFLIESLSMPETIYKEFLDYKAMKDKHDYLQNFNVNTPLDLATTIVVYGGLTEGLQLFSSFALLLNYTRHGLMKNMGQIVTWSFRDESLHVECMAKLFKVLLEEESDSSWNKELEKRINEACHMIIECEDAFIDLCYQTSSDAIRNLEKNDVKQYIRYLADRRLNQFGFKEIFNVTENPLPWIDEITSNVEFASFFETRATEYSKGAMTGSWNDAFN